MTTNVAVDVAGVRTGENLFLVLRSLTYAECDSSE